MSGVGWVSEIGDKIRVLGTRIVREGWVAGFGGLVMEFAWFCGFFEAGSWFGCGVFGRRLFEEW